MKRKILAICLVFAALSSLMVFAEAANLPVGVPSSIEAATVKKAEVLKDESGIPYFQLEIKFPQSFINLSSELPAGGRTLIDYYWKIDNGSWEYLGAGGTDCLFDTSYGFAVPGQDNTFRISYIYPEDEGNSKEIIIKDHTYTLRVMLSYYIGEGDGNAPISSAFSNEVSIGSGSFYQNVSEWAKPELQKAYDEGLIPDILVGSDMTKPITREEFCELSVLLYERVSGKTAEPVSPNPFADTRNGQILKAYKLGITTGTSDTTFSPNVLISREQCAAMLFRAIKAIRPDGDYSVAGVKDFPDQKDISDWAVAATKYMSKTGIIAGDAGGNFMPKAMTTSQQAAGYGMATREQAIAMSLRSYGKI